MPETGYALAKSLCEGMAAEMHRWNPGTRFVALRISNIFECRGRSNFRPPPRHAPQAPTTYCPKAGLAVEVCAA